MLLVVRLDGSADTIDVPQFIIDDLESYKKQFSDWLCDKSVDHSYWAFTDGNGVKYGLSYRSDALVEWLNAFPLHNTKEKASIVEFDKDEYDTSLPSVFF